MKVTDAKGTEHEVEPGQWWWFDGDDGPEVLRVDPNGRCCARTAGWDCPVPFDRVALLEPVVPYAAAFRTRRDVVLDPIPGDVLDAPLYRLRVDKVEDGTVFAAETWYDGATFTQNRSLGGWRRMLGGPSGRRFKVTPAPG